MAGKDNKVKKRNRKNISFGVVTIKASFNNSIVTVSDLNGNVISWSSSGQHGFKGSRKSTPYAALVTTEHAVKLAMEHGLKTVIVRVKGPGNGRESALRAISSAGLTITEIKEVTPIAHNGCRPRKRRRV